MAIQTITYDNKVALNENPDIADINKVTDDDMNEIKSVVNGNSNNAGDLSLLDTTAKSSLVGAINEINSTRLKLLWQNSNPEVAFTTQTIPLSSSDYDYLIWIYRFHRGSGNNSQKSQITLKGANVLADIAWDYGVSGTYYLAEYYRKYTYNSATSFTIGDNVVRYNSGTTTTTDNNYNIPVAVYGGKF